MTRTTRPDESTASIPAETTLSRSRDGSAARRALRVGGGPRRRRSAAAALAAVAALGLSGCGLSPSTSFTPSFEQGSIEPVAGAEDTSVAVVSKNFTEQLILGKILALAAQAAGYDVQDMTNIPGSQPVREMMLTGEGDVTLEYTGTAWLTYMGHEQGIPDPQEQWEAVAEEDRGNGLIWGEPGSFNNTYGLAVNRGFAEEYGVDSISDMHDVPVEERTLCVEPEFNSRSDGLTPLLAHYGLDRGTEVPEDNIGIYDTGAIYAATASGECNFGEVFTTDGRILTLDLQVLEDDEEFFPAYNGAPVFHESTLAESPELKGIMEEVVGRLDNRTLQELNAQVDVEGREPADVAYDWMVEEGFITDPAA